MSVVPDWIVDLHGRVRVERRLDEIQRRIDELALSVAESNPEAMREYSILVREEIALSDEYTRILDAWKRN